MCQLVDSNDAVLMGEHHSSEDGGSDGQHGVHINPSKEYIVVQLGIPDFNVYKDHPAS